MKSKMTTDRYIIECACRSEDHLLVFDIWLDNEVDEKTGKPSVLDISVFMSNNWHFPWYKRIIHALKYIFIKEPYVLGDSISISEENKHQLQEFLDRLTELNKGTRETRVLERLREHGIDSNLMDIHEFQPMLINEILDELEKAKKPS